MVLDKYKIKDDTIMIPKSELERLRDHYFAVGKEYYDCEDDDKAWFYFGKQELLIDILKHFDKLEGE